MKKGKIGILKFMFFLTIIVCMFLLDNESKVEASEIISDGIYTIQSAIDDEFVLDITGASNKNTANVEIWSNNGGSNQKFNIKSVGNGYYSICAINSGKYLDVAWASKSNGANVEQYQYNGRDNQKWLVKPDGNGYYYIISKCNDLYLDIAGGNMKNGTNVITWEKNGGNNQKFKLNIIEKNIIEDGTYKFVSAINENYVLDVTGASTKNGANIEIWDDNNVNNQKFDLNGIGDGFYTIGSTHSKKYLDVEGAKNIDGTNVIQFQGNGGDNQKWILEYAGNNYYYIISKCNGLYLDVANAVQKNGTNVLTWSYNGGTNQKFKLIPTTPNIEDGGRSEEFKKAHPELKVGIDVSRYQGVIDWQKVKKDGIDYAMIRAGFRGYGESGSLNEDTMFERNVKGARDAGLDVGVYFFSQAQNYEEGVKEAEYTINLIKKFDITYPVAFDTEQSSSPTNTGRADNISVQDRTDATKGFCSTIEKAGYKTLIYASPYWIRDNLDITQLSEYKIWLANYTGATQENPLAKPSSYKGQYVMWQYTDKGTVNGIDGGVDCNIFYYEEMK